MIKNNYNYKENIKEKIDKMKYKNVKENLKLINK